MAKIVSLDDKNFKINSKKIVKRIIELHKGLLICRMRADSERQEEYKIENTIGELRNILGGEYVPKKVELMVKIREKKNGK